jgi:hypothetical protein
MRKVVALTPGRKQMKTLMILMAQYDGLAVIPRRA